MENQIYKVTKEIIIKAMKEGYIFANDRHTPEEFKKWLKDESENY